MNANLPDDEMELLADATWKLLQKFSADRRLEFLRQLGELFCVHCGDDNCLGYCQAGYDE